MFSIRVSTFLDLQLMDKVLPVNRFYQEIDTENFFPGIEAANGILRTVGRGALAGYLETFYRVLGEKILHDLSGLGFAVGIVKTRQGKVDHRVEISGNLCCIARLDGSGYLGCRFIRAGSRKESKR